MFMIWGRNRNLTDFWINFFLRAQGIFGLGVFFLRRKKSLLFFLVIFAFGTIGLLAEDPQFLDSPMKKEFKQKVEIRSAPPPEPLKKPSEISEVLSADLLPAQMPLPNEIMAATFQGSGQGLAFRSGDGSATDQLIQEVRSQKRPPRVLSRPEMDYPSSARAKNQQGFVIFKILVGLQGQLQQIKIVRSEPPGVFDETILQAVKAWKFQPGLLDGKVSELWLTQKVRFQID